MVFFSGRSEGFATPEILRFSKCPTMALSALLIANEGLVEDIFTENFSVLNFGMGENCGEREKIDC